MSPIKIMKQNEIQRKFAAEDRINRILSRANVLHRIVENDFSNDPKYLSLLILQLDTALQELESACKELGIYSDSIDDKFLKELSCYEGGNLNDK